MKALILMDGSFPALRRSDSKGGWFDLPGGRMEFGESAEDTIEREVAEETGLCVKPVRVPDTWNNVRETYQFTGIFYLCVLVGGEIKLSQEHDGYEWISAGSSRIDRMHRVFRDRMAGWDWTGILGYKRKNLCFRRSLQRKYIYKGVLLGNAIRL